MPLPSTARRLVLVTGSTRSGTSSAAGTLSHLGLHVPLPVLKPNESNPSGFFESTWPIWFHRGLQERAQVNQTDARPEAFSRMAAAVADADRAALRAWLEGVFAGRSQVVVKDPRAIWLPGLWHETAAELGVVTALVAMVRHPAEVIASRTTYYRPGGRDDDAWRYRVRNLCTWINVNTGLERATRGMPRLVVRYDDLLADWRQVVRRLQGVIELDLDPDADTDATRAADAFIDPGLRRHQPSWEGMDMPDRLVALAEGTWEAMGAHADGRDGPDVATRLDALHAAFVHEMAIARAMTHDTAIVLTRAANGGAATGPGGGGRVQGPGASPSLARRLVRRWVPVRVRTAVADRRQPRSGKPKGPQGPTGR